MQVAEVLSDLTTLQVCDPRAALALVSARPSGSNAVASSTKAQSDDSDLDLKRAKDLLELHANVKMAHRDGTDKELNQAREAVAKVLRDV